MKNSFTKKFSKVTKTSKEIRTNEKFRTNLIYQFLKIKKKTNFESKLKT